MTSLVFKNKETSPRNQPPYNNTVRTENTLALVLVDRTQESSEQVNDGRAHQERERDLRQKKKIPSESERQRRAEGKLMRQERGEVECGCCLGF